MVVLLGFEKSIFSFVDKRTDIVQDIAVEVFQSV
jgi:hypothetical protein